ncbi:hypothetical protein BLNAU_9484 [Blattamonas nauphoetae]|uniref:Uncharacterized protein n=1 Tax=Blattamonas nauphoetae TaxID=2049346 RepID=A0ABQ9XVY7_9EUKA|nr:hypothetical protein BLNAU_9484 [Blattamonas nauphoetae]
MKHLLDAADIIIQSVDKLINNQHQLLFILNKEEGRGGAFGVHVQADDHASCDAEHDSVAASDTHTTAREVGRNTDEARRADDAAVFDAFSHDPHRWEVGHTAKDADEALCSLFVRLIVSTQSLLSRCKNNQNQLNQLFIMSY